MHNSSPLLAALFGDLMVGILSATLLEAGREWYLSDLAGHLGVTPSSLQRPLAGLVGAGILKRRRDGNRVYFSADVNCVIFRELAGVVGKGVASGGGDGEVAAEDAAEKLAVDL